MERIRRSLKGHYWGKIITYFLTCCLFLNTSLPVALAEVVLQPDGVIRGDISVIPDPVIPDRTNMTASDGAIGHFSDFNIAAGHVVDCVQPGTDASALFRVFSVDGTQILGQFDANGSVYLIDPAGILFGVGSQINVNRLIASGLNMSNDAFDAARAGGEMVFAGGNGQVKNEGGVIRANGLYLIGQKVFNKGPIIATDGLVVMAAGEQVILAQDGSNVSVVVSDIGYSLDIRTSNVISAPNGKIVLAAGDTFSRAIKNVSIMAASGGEISIEAAQIENNGLISVSSSSGNGGSVNLTGTEKVTIGIDGSAGNIEANAGPNGDGGSVTIQTDGLFQIGEDSTITATGGSVSGDGGAVTITCDDFEIAGDIFASPGNKINEPGKLEINTPSVIIADSDDPLAMDTLYEDDIESLSQSGTSLIVNAAESITVENIDDNEITGQFGDIQLLADKENVDSFVYFEDKSDTIRTTLGDIIISAGGGLKADDVGGTEGVGIDVGNLITGKDLPAEKPAPGIIFLTTGSGGDITTGNLTVSDGWGDGDEARYEIDVKSSGNLTVNGDVMVGSSVSPILNVADERAAEATVILRADNDLTLDGSVGAYANGSEVDSSITKATIDIIAGNNATITGNLSAEATSSSSGTADAVITVEAVGEIDFPGTATAIADELVEVSTGPNHEPDPDGQTNPEGDHAQIIIDESAIFLLNDTATTPKSAPIEIDVLFNDTLEGQTIDSYDIDPADGSLTEVKEGELIVRLIYNPPEDLSGLKFNETGKATVTFTYTVEDQSATVTVTLTNGLPVAVEDIATTTLGKSVTIDVLVNDTDQDLDDILTAIEGAITTKNGTVVLNEDGTFTYTPNEGFLGDDSFTYFATDGFNDSSEVEVKITVSETPPLPPSLPYIQAAPGLDRLDIEIEVSGCPALVKWAAEEIGIDERLVQIWVANSLASTGNIQPCDACQGLKNAAKILQDADGTHIAALAQVINEFASSTAPPTEEQMASIADAIARNTDEDSYYAIADEYLDALATYVGILSSEMGFSTTESVQLVTDKYIGRLAESQNVGVAAFIAASLAALGG